ncbi:hypothetical protein BH09GEM1_BH09GEM1_42070 [soil metagenome]
MGGECAGIRHDRHGHGQYPVDRRRRLLQDAPRACTIECGAGVIGRVPRDGGEKEVAVRRGQDRQRECLAPVRRGPRLTYALELRRRVTIESRSMMVHPAQTLHSLAMNRGRPANVRDALAIARAAEPIPPGFSIVYFAADQIPVLDALFWGGDSSEAVRAIARLEPQVARAVPRESGARARHFTNLCVTLLWRQMRSGRRNVGPGLDVLRRGAASGDSSGFHGGSPALCVSMLDALIAVDASSVARLDTLMAAGPFQFGVDFGNLVVARLQEQRGNIPAATRAIRPRPYDWDTSPLYLTTFLREEGRLAALTGDAAGAARANLHLAALATR